MTLRYFTLLILITLPTLVLAGLPPTTLSGQSASGAKPTTFNFIAPFKQATQVSGINSRIETGSENLLPNPNFESKTLNWSTFSGSGTVSINTAAPVMESQSLELLDGGSGNLVAATSSIVSVPAGMNNSNGQFFCRFKNKLTTSAGITISIQDNATNVLNTTSFTLSGAVSSPVNQLQGLNFIYNGTLTGVLPLISVTTASADVEVDDCYVGPAINLGFAVPTSVEQDAGALTITGTTTNPTKGTTTTDHFWWHQVGPNLVARIEFAQTTAGTTGSGDYLIAIPASVGCQIDSSKVTFNNTIGSNSGAPPKNVLGSAGAGAAGAVAGTGYVSAYDATHVRLMLSATTTPGTFQAQNSGWYALNEANFGMSASFSVPCVGWSGNQTAFSNTCGTDGSCVNEFSAQVSTAGAVTNQNVSGWLASCTNATPQVCTFKTNFFSQIPNCTATVFDASTAVTARIEAVSTSSITVHEYTTTASTQAAFSLHCSRQGSDIKPQINAPVIIGGVSTSSSTSSFRIESARFGGASTTTVCSSSPCTLYANSGGFSSITRSATGMYVANFVSGTFSSVPQCTFTVGNGANVLTVIETVSTPPTTTTFAFNPSTVAAAAADVYGSIICMGQH